MEWILSTLLGGISLKVVPQVLLTGSTLFSLAIEYLLQKSYKNEHNQNEWDRIYDTLKKRMELEKLGVSTEKL